MRDLYGSSGVISTTLIALGALSLSACSAFSGPPARQGAVIDGAQVPGFSFVPDSFAFANVGRMKSRGVDDPYANYCFVLSRSLRQFFQFARFDPHAPRLTDAEYLQRIERIMSYAPWDPPLPAEERVIIPGYANLRDFSNREESTVKEGVGSRFWSLVHWTNWRVVLPVTRRHQERLAQQVVDELRAGRLVQLLVTDLPEMQLDHGIVAYAYRATPQALEFAVWDPNDPAGPGAITFDRTERRFWASRLIDTQPEPIRVFRMYYWWLL